PQSSVLSPHHLHPMPARDPRRVEPYQGLRVVRFHIWQDLTHELSDGVAPLHATLTLEMAGEWYTNLSKPGAIRIEGLRDTPVVEGALLVHQAHYGLGLTQPGSRQMQFVMSPTPLCPRLDPNGTVRGIARMRFGDRHVTIQLP